MPWTYHQSTGVVEDPGSNEVTTSLTVGYSGAPGYRDRHETEHLRDRGPIPVGSYTIGPDFIMASEGRSRCGWSRAATMPTAGMAF